MCHLPQASTRTFYFIHFRTFPINDTKILNKIGIIASILKLNYFSPTNKKIKMVVPHIFNSPVYSIPKQVSTLNEHNWVKDVRLSTFVEAQEPMDKFVYATLQLLEAYLRSNSNYTIKSRTIFVEHLKINPIYWSHSWSQRFGLVSTYATLDLTSFPLGIFCWKIFVVKYIFSFILPSVEYCSILQNKR